MTLDAIIVIGAMVTALPFLGFPLAWDNVILVVLGIATIALGIIVRRRGLTKRPTSPSFVDSHQPVDPHAL